MVLLIVIHIRHHDWSVGYITQFKVKGYNVVN